MEGKELLRLLLEKRGLNANSLADTLRDRSLQSQIQRYLGGRTKNPRPDTLEPIAKYFGVGVEAFYQPVIAKQIADRLLLTTQTPGIADAPAPYSLRPEVAAPTPIKTRSGLREAVLQLGRTLETYDESARKAVSSLLADLALQPGNAPLIANRITALLDAPGNDLPQKSITSPGQ
jgi:transcriptional regulator with XRE-family HTH domain